MGINGINSHTRKDNNMDNKTIKEQSDTKGKHFVANGNDVFVYWDFNAPENENGNKWRMATNPLKVEVA